MFLDIWSSISHGKAVGGSVGWGWVMGRLGDTGGGWGGVGVGEKNIWFLFEGLR